MDSLSLLTRLNAALAGRYRVERQLGEGGMATVYLADDLKHERQVALKVLKPELAAVVGAERFLAEIKMTANLQHPHILPLFDSGEADSFLFYVMPYVEGESLRDRLDHEHQLPVDEAVRIATGVAEALDYAHARGVIHRDIKPANILLQAGKPVISDFGIALAVNAGGAGRLTETGLSLGTPHYMSPEQATGDARVGPATDIYALGCVLYEMLVGEPPYTGSTPQAVLGRIIAGEPAVASRQRPSVPANVDAAIRRALEKIPADRFASAGDLARALADRAFRHGQAVGAARSNQRPVAVLAIAVALFAGLAIWGWTGRGTPTNSVGVTRLTASLPPDHRVALPEWNTFPLAISPDGRTLAYVGESAAGTQLYVRRLDSYEAVALGGTRGASQPFFSPDGAWLAYFAGRDLYRVRVDGGAPIRVARLDAMPAGGAWGPDGLIVVAVDTELWRLDSGGRELERVPWSGQGMVGWPTFLPSGAGGWKTPSVLVSKGDELFAVSVLSGEARSLNVRANGHGVYADGFLVYSEQTGVAYAVPFDPVNLRVTGTAISVLEDVLRPNLTAATVLVLSSTGTLAYMPGTSQRRLVLVDRAGRETTLPFRPGAYRAVKVSPDGRLVLTERRGEGRRILDLASGADNSARIETLGVWSPDGREMAAPRGDRLLRVPAIPGSPGPATDIPFLPWSDPSHWGDDGTILFNSFNQRADLRGGIFSIRADGSGPIETVLDSEADEQFPSRSPDGRWLAYRSDASGGPEVYVRPFAGGESRIVSVNGGDRPVFSRNGRELFYLSGERVYAVPTHRFDQAGPLEPELLFVGSYVQLGPSWDTRPQGDFVMVSAGPRWLRDIMVVQSWTTELAGLFEEGARPPRTAR